MYTPIENMPDVQNKLPPRFYCLHKIEIINNGFMKCSCGLYHRMMIPCRLVLFLIKEYNPSMFGICLLSIYQDAFERRHYESMTNLFREIENAMY